MFLRDGLQATAGVNHRGDMVIAMLDPAAVNFNNSQLGFGLIPISDYQASSALTPKPSPTTESPKFTSTPNLSRLLSPTGVITPPSPNPKISSLKSPPFS